MPRREPHPCTRRLTSRVWHSVAALTRAQYNAIYIPMELCFVQQLIDKHPLHIAIDFFGARPAPCGVARVCRRRSPHVYVSVDRGLAPLRFLPL